MDKVVLGSVALAGVTPTLGAGGANAALIALIVQVLGLVASFLMGAKKGPGDGK